MRNLLAHRDARLLLLGETLSRFGDSALFLAMGIWVKSLTGSNAAAGMVFFVIVAPGLLAPLGGLLVDRVRRRPLMIALDLAVGAAVLLLLFVHGRDQVWLIYLVAALYGAGASVFASAQSALLTVMLPKYLLGDANAIFQTSREGLRLVAPLAGAGLYAAFGGGTVAVVDAATFGCSALCLLLLHTREPEPARAEHHFLTELAAGVRYVGRTIPLRQIVLTVAAALLVFGFTETLIFAIVTQGLHRPPSFLGVLATTQGIGAIAGGLTAGQLLRHLGDARLVALGLAVAGTGVALTVASSLPAVVLGIVIAGAAIPWAIVGFGTAIQLRTPAHLQGRVYSAADTMVGTPQTISIALGAGLSTLVDYRLLLLVITAVTLGCAAYLATRQIPAALEAPSEVPLQPLEASELPPQAG